MTDFDRRYDFITKLNLLLDSNIELITCLEIMKNKDDEISKSISKLRNGKSLSKVFDNISKDKYFLKMIDIADKVSNIKLISKLLKEQYDFEKNLKNEIIKLTIYPLFIFTLSIIVTFLLLIFLIPQFKVLYNDMNKELPLITNIIIRLSDYIIYSFTTIVIMLIILIFSLYLFFNYYSIVIRKKLYQINLYKYVLLLRFCIHMKLMLSSNINLIDSLNLFYSKDLYFMSQIRSIAYKIEKGFPITLSFKVEIFDKEFMEFIKIIDRAGNEKEVFSSLALIYEKRLNSKISIFFKILEPLSILIISSIIAIITISIMLPLFSIDFSI